MIRPRGLPAVLLPLLVALLASGCSTGPRTGPVVSTATSATAGAHPQASSTTVRRTPAEVVTDPDSRLLAVAVTRRSRGFRVVTGWACVERHCRRDRAIAVSQDGFRNVRQVRWTGRNEERLLQRRLLLPGFPTRDTAMKGLMAQQLHSLAQGVIAVVGGGDGATLFPFERTGRSTDGGRTFTTVEVSSPASAQPYSSGGVVLPDGRLLVLLDHWSDDGAGQPSDRWHGLYLSAGDDWSSYAPQSAEFAPPLTPAPRGFSPLVALTGSPAHGGVVWVQTWDDRVYVSTDGAASFRRIRIR